MIRLTIPSIDEEDIAAVSEVLRSGYLVQGPKVKELEERFAAYVGSRHAVALPNCTCALHLALVALDVGAGDKVAVCTYSWPATANVIRIVGATPVFVDIDRDTYNMDPAALERALTHHRVKAVLPVHTFGNAADIERIVAIADRHGAAVVEDAACALGTEQGGRRAGSFGRIGCFSLHPRKAITTGEGGVLTTDDDAIARMVRMLRNHGQDPDAATPTFMLPGYNLRMTEFQGAFGLTQFHKLERIIAARRAGAAEYDRLLEGTDIGAPRALPGTRHVYQTYLALLPAALGGAKRDRAIAEMRARGVESTFGTYHMPLIKYFREWGGYKEGDFPVTDEIAGRVIALPLYEGLGAGEQRQVIDTLKDVVAGLG